MSYFWIAEHSNNDAGGIQLKRLKNKDEEEEGKEENNVFNQLWCDDIDFNNWFDNCMEYISLGMKWLNDDNSGIDNLQSKEFSCVKVRYLVEIEFIRLNHFEQGIIHRYNVDNI